MTDKTQSDERYFRVRDLVNQNRNEEAMKLVLDLLDENPDDPTSLHQFGTLMLKDRRHGAAYNIFARGCKVAPEAPEMWLNYARSHPDTPEAWGRIEWCLRKALKLYDKQGKPATVAWANLGMLYYIRGNYDEAESCANKAVKCDPTNDNALATMGFVHLAKGRWSKAWSLYDALLRTGVRENHAYPGTEHWDGTPGKRVVVTGEQGIGDEIMYCSVLGDLVKDSELVVVECMPRLENLFRRSFPEARVYGQRWKKEIFWEENHDPQYHVAMATLPKYYRNSDADFPGVPYLTPDPEQKQAFRGLLDSLGPKPKIGITWTGGTSRTRGYLRTRTLEELLPILRQDATFISLEYHNRDQEIAEFQEKRGIGIHVFHWITDKGLDYDLTASLVSELDLVISVPTTVTQMAGAVGVEAWVLVPKYTGWIFGRDSYPWAKSVVPLRNPPIMEVAEKLETWLSTRTVTSRPLLQTG